MNGVAEYRVQARNLSHASENRIHDDGIARRFGFEGALVPGVEVYAYMTHPAVERWGAEWLTRGTAECRFVKPVYDGKLVTVVGEGEGSEMSLTLESGGERCATGAARLSQGHSEVAVPEPASIPEHDARPDADEAALAVGRRLSSRPLHFTRDKLAQYLADIGETATIYSREQLVHPAFMLRLANLALKENVKLGAWIHVGSSVRHCGVARAGATLAAHALVAANYERKGHRYVDLDVVVVADGSRAVAQVRHTAIYRLRDAGPEE